MSLRFFRPAALALLITALTIPALKAPARQSADDPQLAHIVFFELKEDTPQTRDQLVQACKKYLSGHEGTAHFSVGTRAPEFDREVNDHDFDVSLNVIFSSKAAHDAYQTHPRHLKFIEENSANWAKVRVFDSYLAP